MGNQVSSAQYMALGAFLVNVGTQTYGMVTSPTMKDVADANHFAFSPHPMFIGAFFSGQTILQIYWLRQLFMIRNGYQTINSAGLKKTGAATAETEHALAEEEAVRAATEYAPIFALGNLCIAGWLLFWLKSSFWTSQALVTINTVAHLIAVARLPPLTANSSRLLHTTHFVAKSIAGIGLLDFIDNGGVATALTYAFFPVAAAFAGPFFGSTIAYDVLAVYVGQRDVLGAGKWAAGLGWTALATAGVVAGKAVMAFYSS